MNKIALYLCVMFAPLCLVAYIFEQTRFMFMAWAKFTVTTLFSLALITVITVIAMKVVLFVAAALILVEITGGGADLKSIATAQGGVGMLLSTLILGAPPLITNFFSGQVAAAFQNYNAVGGAAKSGGGLPGSPQEMMAGSSGLGANTQQNVAGGGEAPIVAGGEKSLLGINNQTPVPVSGNDGIKSVASSRGNAAGAGGYNAANTQASVASTPATAARGIASSADSAYAAVNRAEEQALVAQKAQASSANRAPAPSAVSTPSAGGTASQNNTPGSASPSHHGSDATASSSSHNIRLANAGMGDDSAAIKQKYGSRGVARSG